MPTYIVSLVQHWNTVFVMQGVVSIGLGRYEENKESLVRALTWIEGAQMMEDSMHYHTAYRHGTKGAWGFRFVPRPTFLLWFPSPTYNCHLPQYERTRIYS